VLLPTAATARRGSAVREGRPGAPVALDCMGGDAAPAAALEAARALGELGVPVRLVGHPDVVGPEGVAAAEVVGMAEAPAFALRSRPDASVRVAAREVAHGRASALVSAGSTGATVAAALLEIGREPGVRRPLLAARVPTATGHALLLDVGALPGADSAQLLAAAELGVAEASRTGTPAPRVGLLNVGAEPGRGDAVRRRAHGLLGAVAGFVGNVEPADVLDGRADVVVTDGFTGNLVLKAFEAVRRGRQDPPADAAAQLLGVRGTVLVAHGAATAADLVAAVRQAAAIVRAAPAAGVAP
jgi:glycerol-3-phosphate acyltransferase PlsX